MEGGAMIDPFADEPAVPIDEELYRNWRDAQDAVNKWQAYVDKYADEIRLQIGSAHAGLVHGVKVVTNRPQNRWSLAGLQRDHKSLTQHFVREVTKEEFDFQAFSVKYPDIAEKYRARSLRVMAE
jgi:hypothetical protein